MFDQLIFGLQVALTPTNLLYALLGATLGTAVGVLPGLGTVATMALLLPMTYHTEPVSAVIMIAGIFYGAQYGGSTTAILLRIPGEESSITTTLDGHQMALQGRAGAALGMSALASFIGGTLGVVGLCFAAPVLSSWALKFGPPEYCALALFGLMMVVYLSEGSTVKGAIMGACGLAAATIGLDPVTGLERFTFNSIHLRDGLDLVPVAMGLFGISEIMLNLENPENRQVLKSSIRKLLPTKEDWRQSFGPITRGSLLGFFIGILPGGGATISSFIAYGMEKRVAKHPEQFGKGTIKGIAGPEAANNAASTSSFIPLMTLGIPGNLSTGMVLVALMIHGIRPGPTMMSDHPELFWGIIGSMYVGNLMLLCLNLPMIWLWVRLLHTPYHHLILLIVVVCVVGAYSVSSSTFSIGVMTVFGVVGYILRKAHFPVAPFLLAMILGEMIESTLQQTLVAEDGDLLVFVQRPISAAILGFAALFMLKPLFVKFLFSSKSVASTSG
jgi:putative tricarboxylic transport membrane protein